MSLMSRLAKKPEEVQVPAQVAPAVAPNKPVEASKPAAVPPATPAGGIEAVRRSLQQLVVDVQQLGMPVGFGMPSEVAIAQAPAQELLEYARNIAQALWPVP